MLLKALIRGERLTGERGTQLPLEEENKQKENHNQGVKQKKRDVGGMQN